MQKHLVQNHFELVVDVIFKNYKSVFNKNYKGNNEHAKRKEIFRHNMRLVQFYKSSLIKIMKPLKVKYMP